MISRRDLLAAVASSVFFWPALSGAEIRRGQRFVLMILRGGLDGLAAVVPYGDRAFASLARRARINEPEDSLHRLDSTFALHPSLKGFSELYAQKELAILHACAPAYRARSHFEAQDCLENGTEKPHGARDGWLNRALAALARANGVAIASSMPLVLRGKAAATTWAPSPLQETNAELAQRIAALYSEDAQLGPVFARAMEMNGTKVGAGRPRQRLSEATSVAAAFLRRPDGPQVAVLHDGGWDTHSQQNGRLRRKLAELNDGVQALRTGLGDLWRSTVLVVVTEFGRTAAANGTGGTDHGTGGVLFLIGGAVRGGRILGDWPGLSPNDLHERRDLRATSDLRAAFKGVLRDHMAIPEDALLQSVFPQSAKAAPIDGLIRR